MALKDKDNLVRESAAEALESIGSEGAVKPLLLALKDKKVPQLALLLQPNNSIISFLSCQIKSHRLRELN
ncbi:MAG: hypothetical protein BRC49_16545 [Cyanobacteria bacterium SW_10_48_33]|nr:MAG: hypothetical protein BRC49_16545 [Cyanobacteria bacterium SW_10_48_33]